MYLLKRCISRNVTDLKEEDVDAWGVQWLPQKASGGTSNTTVLCEDTSMPSLCPGPGQLGECEGLHESGQSRDRVLKGFRNCPELSTRFLERFQMLVTATVIIDDSDRN
ncbi:hypothetical protein TREES_T100002569 [Tupaia chinensis]|uniref:Uncharacterized protein n=1 Tax=Tupaia chinensis TaxID=246437 RepID=L9L6A2_TUPCH|nr:hypothetical protein TREES_T100002569 [Tupaia chinensis]